LDLKNTKCLLGTTRPTAVNLAWALDKVSESDDMEEAAEAIHCDDVQLCRRLGKAGAGLLKGGVMTICNTGSLATGGHGTALGMVRSALEQGTALRLYITFNSTTKHHLFMTSQ